MNVLKMVCFKWYNMYITSFILTLHHKLDCFVGNNVLIIMSCLVASCDFDCFRPRYIVLNERAEKHSPCNGKD